MLRSILGPLKEFSARRSFERLMFHATGNHDFAIVPPDDIRLGNVDESCVGEAIDTTAELDIQRLKDPIREDEASEFLAKLHAIARITREESNP